MMFVEFIPDSQFSWGISHL